MARQGEARRGEDKQGKVDFKRPAISVVGWNGGNSNAARIGGAGRCAARHGAAAQGKAII